MAIRLRAPLGALIGVVLGVSPAHAADFPVVVECPGWSAEATGQVEARIRAALQADGLVASNISVVCGPGDALEVRVASQDGALARQVERKSEHVEDDVVWSVEAALNELKKSATAVATAPEPVAPPAAPPTPPEPAPVAPPPSAPTPRPAAPTPVTPAMPPMARREGELAAKPLIERWSDLWALGAEASGSFGSESLRFGLALGGRVALPEPSDFQLSELTGNARLSLSPLRTLGIRVELGLGVSMLSVVPRDGVVAQSGGTARSAGFAELNVSRPFWLGTLAISPNLGARAFFAPRRVDVDRTRSFELPTVVPQAGVSVIYRL